MRLRIWCLKIINFPTFLELSQLPISYQLCSCFCEIIPYRWAANADNYKNLFQNYSSLRVQPGAFYLSKALQNKKKICSFRRNPYSAKTAINVIILDTNAYSNSEVSKLFGWITSRKVSVINIPVHDWGKKNNYRTFCSVEILIMGKTEKLLIEVTSLGSQI